MLIFISIASSTNKWSARVLTKNMKRTASIILAIFLLFNLGTLAAGQKAKGKQNEVLVLGTIHGGHLTDPVYNVEYLKKLIRVFKPDFILTEIPPDRFEAAMAEFQKTGAITEPRVRVFPEYVNVIFPLTREMKFEIIPTAGWTKIMNDERSRKLRAISQDPARKADWAEYQAAEKRSDEMLKAAGNPNDPYFIHTDEYDRIQDVGLQVYNRLFNMELGLGGWDNINIAHYWNIEKALEKYRYQGKRFLITYGAGHKGWFIRELRKRDDIKLLEMKPFLDKVK